MASPRSIHIHRDSYGFFVSRPTLDDASVVAAVIYGLTRAILFGCGWDLPVWRMTATATALTAHLVVDHREGNEVCPNAAAQGLRKRFSIGPVDLQPGSHRGDS